MPSWEALHHELWVVQRCDVLLPAFAHSALSFESPPPHNLPDVLLPHTLLFILLAQHSFKHLFKEMYFIIFIRVFCLTVGKYIVCMHGMHGGENRVLDPLDLEL